MTGATDWTVAVVTGANRGIGRELVRQLASRDWTVVLGAREGKGGRAAREVAGARGRVLAWQLDVTNQASVDRLASWARDEIGRVDVLINNAAIQYDTWQRAVAADLDLVHEAMETNLFGAWRTSETLIPLIRESRHGRIVNVSSRGGSLAEMHGGTPAYGVSKAALNALTRKLAAELRRDGILVNAVCPGWAATDMGGPGGRPVAQGAACVLWAVDLPDDGPTGGFFRDGHPVAW